MKHYNLDHFTVEQEKDFGAFIGVGVTLGFEVIVFGGMLLIWYGAWCLTP